jgi:hypothetical protein
MWKKSSPAAVVVSIASVSDRNPISRFKLLDRGDELLHGASIDSML